MALFVQFPTAGQLDSTSSFCVWLFRKLIRTDAEPLLWLSDKTAPLPCDSDGLQCVDTYCIVSRRITSRRTRRPSPLMTDFSRTLRRKFSPKHVQQSTRKRRTMGSCGPLLLTSCDSHPWVIGCVFLRTALFRWPYRCLLCVWH